MRFFSRASQLFCVGSGTVAAIASFSVPLASPESRVIAPLASSTFTSDGQSVRLAIVGDFQGSLAPCGCTSPMTGGVARMVSYIDSLRANSNLLVVMTGGLIPNISNQTAIEVRQNILKAQALAQFAVAMKADAFTIGSNEASYGASLVSQLQILSGGRALVSGVSEPSGSISKDRFMIASADIESPTVARALQGQNPDIQPESMEESAKRLVQKAFPDKVPILVLRGSKKDAEAIANEFPSISLITYASSGSSPLQPEIIGKTLLLSPGDLGREVVSISFSSQNGFLLSTYKVRKLTPDISDSHKAKVPYEQYLLSLGANHLLADLPRPSDSKFAGSFACMKCHLSSFTIWQHSGHARAYQTLVLKGHQQDPDCVNCHVTGLESKFGFRSPINTHYLAAVTCENCHGPGREHIRQPRLFKVDLGKNACIKCHTHENSPNFDFTTYWAKIKHK